MEFKITHNEKTLKLTYDEGMVPIRLAFIQDEDDKFLVFSIHLAGNGISEITDDFGFGKVMGKAYSGPMVTIQGSGLLVPYYLAIAEPKEENE